MGRNNINNLKVLRDVLALDRWGISKVFFRVDTPCLRPRTEPGKRRSVARLDINKGQHSGTQQGSRWATESVILVHDGA